MVLLLWFTGKRDHARHVLLGTIICFYSGYVLYVLFPAAPPRLYFESLGLFSVTLRGGPIANFQQALIEMMPNQAARAAFPSLHSAVSLLSLAYAWRYLSLVLPDPAGVRRAGCSCRRSTCAITGSWICWPAPRSCRGCCGSRRASSAGGHVACRPRPPSAQRRAGHESAAASTSGRGFSYTKR